MPAAMSIGRKFNWEFIVRVLLVPVLILAAIAATACSSQQLYASGQAQQRNECDKVVDFQERQRCMARANTSYETYQRQSEEVKRSTNSARRQVE
jgi:membrane protein DedA with SNARE-associated domain